MARGDGGGSLGGKLPVAPSAGAHLAWGEGVDEY